MSRSHKLIYSFLTVITLFLTCPAHAYYTYVVGDLYTADSVRHNYGPQADATYTKQRIMGKTVAYHSESGCVSLSSMIGAVWIPVRGGGHAYCIANESFDTPLRLKRGYGTPAGQTPDGTRCGKPISQAFTLRLKCMRYIQRIRRFQPSCLFKLI